jgi:hypothetical protein
MNTYTIEYYAATYKGKRTVKAEDPEEAIAKVRAYVRKQMTLPMYSDGYKVLGESIEEENESYE